VNDRTKIIPPDQPQRTLIESRLEVNLLVEAAAGTGKTTGMVARMAALISSGRCRPENLAAVTFTRKAAGELRSRFQRKLEELAADQSFAGRGEPAFREALEHPERSFVGTIHSFCARLIRERPVEAGIDPDFTEIEEDLDAELREQAWHEFVASLYVTDNPLLDELTRTGLEPGALFGSYLRFCDFPDVDQWPAPEVDLPDTQALKTALADYAGHMLALSEQLPEECGTDTLIPEYRRIPRLMRQADLDDPAGLAEISASFKERVARKAYWPSREIIDEEVSRWEAFRSEWAEPFNRAWRGRRYQSVIRLLAEAAGYYGKLRRRRKVLNFADLLLAARGLLATSVPARRYFSCSFTHLLVDEFQDTDPLQAEILFLLTADDPACTDWRNCRPRPGSLFVVGDPKQSIYRFRRADIVTYNQVKQIIRNTGGEVVQLSTNFRSAPELTGWVNRTFAEVFQDDEFSPAYVPLVAAGGPESRTPGRVEQIFLDKGYGAKESILRYEPQIVADQVRHELSDCPDRPPGVLVLTWKKENLRAYSACLERLGIEHQVTGSSALANIRQAWYLYLCLSALVHPEDPLPLVAALRSGLFGVTDSGLYQFKCAGGRFDFRTEVPTKLEEETAAQFREAFGRLAGLASCLRVLTPVAAVERIAGELGLFAAAAAEPGGNMRSGTLCRLVELLRSGRARFGSLADSVAYLGRLARGEEPADSLPAVPGRGPAVRVMNLHKAKGLEAEVVFLADPTGWKDFPPDCHVDRSGGLTLGYLAVTEQSEFGRGRLLAHHPDWETLAEKEKQFLEAERLRLLYVAATRAGRRLVVTRRESRPGSNPWQFFDGPLEGTPEVPHPRFEDRPRETAEAPEAAAAEIPVRPDFEQRWSQARRPGYRVERARELALADSGRPALKTSGEHGTEWGRVIHRLLLARLENPTADIPGLARRLLPEESLEADRAQEAAAVVESVTESEIWRRAQAAERWLAEVPFEVGFPDLEGEARIVRGVLDLTFLEQGGWVIVDYKTDRGDRTSLESLAERYREQLVVYSRAWECVTGEKVKEAGLYFTASGDYIIIHN